MKKTNRKTFTKIRKWAEEQGYEVIDSKYFEEIKVVVNEELAFEIENRESTIYTSIRGKKGNPKGIYFSIIRNGREGYAFHYTSQNAIIEKMEDEIVRYNRQNKPATEEVVEAEKVEITAEEIIDTEVKEEEVMKDQITVEIKEGKAIAHVPFDLGKVSEDKVSEDGKQVAVAVGMNTKNMTDYFARVLYERAEHIDFDEFKELLDTYFNTRILSTIGVEEAPLQRNYKGKIEGLREDVVLRDYKQSVNYTEEQYGEFIGFMDRFIDVYDSEEEAFIRKEMEWWMKKEQLNNEVIEEMGERLEREEREGMEG